MEPNDSAQGTMQQGTAGQGTAPPDAVQPARRRMLQNWSMFGKLALFATMMFGFGWAMIPLYNAICEATGLRVLTQRDDGAQEIARNSQVDTTRTIIVEFDANSHGPWRFKPQVRSVQAHPGELVTVEYELENLVEHTVAGQAIPSYAPAIASRYFHKVECFCFQQQMLEARETRRFPVVFVIGHEMPAEINQITLSYTFFDVAGKVGQATRSDGRGG